LILALNSFRNLIPAWPADEDRKSGALIGTPDVIPEEVDQKFPGNYSHWEKFSFQVKLIQRSFKENLSDVRNNYPN